MQINKRAAIKILIAALVVKNKTIVYGLLIFIFSPNLFIQSRHC